MAYAYATRKPTPARYARWIAVGIVMFPLSLTRVDFRAARRLIVGAHHASPAYAAFEDLSTTFEPDPTVSTAALPALNAGRTIAAVNHAPELRHVTLAGLTIRRPAAEPAPRAAVIARADAPAKPAAGIGPEPSVADLYADPENTVGDVAARLVRRELAKQDAARVIESASGTKIIVRGNDDPRGIDAVAKREAADAHDSTEPVEFRPLLAAVEAPAGGARQIWLDGRLEMTGGLAHLGPETDLVIKRTVDGRTHETGRIWVTEGKFEIHVAQPTGLLVAELQMRNGRVLGRGQMNLGGLAQPAARVANRIGDLRIELSPTTESASLRAISGYSYGQRKLAVRDARVEIQSVTQAMTVDEEGFADEPSLGSGSSFVARATAPGHWPSVVVGQTDQPRDVRLLSNAMVDALLDLNVGPGDRRGAELEGVVWGRVSDGAAAVSGARVELTEGYRPIYFNDLYLPDATMHETGGNGLFAFVNVKAGVQAVRVRRGRRAYPAQIFATEPKHVSYVELGLRNKVVTNFRVRDVLVDGSPVPADLKLVGTDARLTTDGNADVRYDAAGDSMMVEADAGPAFEVSRATVGGTPEHVTIPVVRREWLSGLYRTTQITPAPDRGAVVGFIDGQDFEVEMTGGLLKERLPIVYFDAKGAVVEGLTGVAGGGFAILNAPPGLQTVHVHPTQSRASYSRVVVAEPNLVQVMTWSPTVR